MTIITNEVPLAPFPARPTGRGSGLSPLAFFRSRLRRGLVLMVFYEGYQKSSNLPSNGVKTRLKSSNFDIKFDS